MFGGRCGRRSGRPTATRGRGGRRRLEQQAKSLDRWGRRGFRRRCIINLHRGYLHRCHIERCGCGLLGRLAWRPLGRLAWSCRHISDRCAHISGRICHDGWRKVGRLLRRAGFLGGFAWSPLGSGLLCRSCGIGRHIRCSAGTEDVVVVRCHLGRLPVIHVARTTPGPLALIAAWCAVRFVSRAGCGRDGSRIATSRGSRFLARHRLRCRRRPSRQPMDQSPSRLQCAAAPAPAESPGVMSAA